MKEKGEIEEEKEGKGRGERRRKKKGGSKNPTVNSNLGTFSMFGQASNHLTTRTFNTLGQGCL